MGKTVEELYKAICTSVFEVLPEKWSLVIITAKIIWTYSELEAEYLPAPKATPMFLAPGFSVLRSFEELRMIMADAQPGKGAWYTAVFSMTPDGKFKMEFDYEHHPRFDTMPTEEEFQEDLKRFPRKKESR